MIKYHNHVRRFKCKFQSLEPIELRGTFYRTVMADFANTALAVIWSRRTGGRYNRKGAFEALYVADTPETAFFEVGALMKVDDKIKGTRFAPRTVLTIDVALSRAVDLNDPVIRKAFIETDAPLYEPWRVEQIERATITQQLGAAARAANIEALIVPSEPARGSTNLVIFTDRLVHGSSISIFTGESRTVLSSTISGPTPISIPRNQGAKVTHPGNLPNRSSAVQERKYHQENCNPTDRAR